MTKILQKAFELAVTLPDARQDEIGAMLIGMVEQDNSRLRLSKAQLAEVENRLAGAADVATDEEVEAFFARLAG